MEKKICTQDGQVERVDDIPLLISLQKKIGIGEVIDDVIPRHWFQDGLSIGELVVGWITYILSQGDHRKVAVREWSKEHKKLLGKMLRREISDTDFTDDRLGQVLSHLSDDCNWQEIEENLWMRSIQAYKIEGDVFRLDASNVEGKHTVTQESLMQYGYSKTHSYNPQVKLMAGTMDIGINGQLIATEIVSGEKADDILYKPILSRMRKMLGESGLLYLGDSKMSSLSTRRDIAINGDYYLVPLSRVGTVPELLERSVKMLVEGEKCAEIIYKEEEKCKNPILAMGYETNRRQSYPDELWEGYIRNIQNVIEALHPLFLGVKDDYIKSLVPKNFMLSWEERLFVLRSQEEAKKALAILERNLNESSKALKALTPSLGKGKKQISTEEELHVKAQNILKEYGVQDYLAYKFEKQETIKTTYIGRGRGSENRPTHNLIKVRYVITDITRNKEAIDLASWNMGWRLYATNKPTLSMEAAIRLYRNAPRIERNFHLFKDTPIDVEPLYVKRNDQIKGIIRLLSLCVRLLTLIEIVVRRNLTKNNATLKGLYDGKPNQETDKPTAIRLLKAFRNINKAQLNIPGQTIFYINPLSDLQKNILQLLNLNEKIYDLLC